MEPLESLFGTLSKEMRDKKLFEFVKFCISFHEDKYRTLPVSISFHGSEAGVEGSNLQHILRTVHLALSLRPILEMEPYQLDYDRFLTAISLHDMGKLLCYAKDPNGWRYFGVDSASHPGIGAELVEKYANQFDISVEDILEAIKSHYGPFGMHEPKTPLAWAVHLIEMIDTKCKT